MRTQRCKIGVPHRSWIVPTAPYKVRQCVTEARTHHSLFSYSSVQTGIPDASSLAQLLRYGKRDVMVLRCSCSQIASSSSGGGGPSRPSRPTLNLQQQGALAAALLSSAFGMPMEGIPKSPPGPSLAQVLEPDIFVRYVQQPGMLERLAEYLPESQRQRIHSVMLFARVLSSLGHRKHW